MPKKKTTPAKPIKSATRFDPFSGAMIDVLDPWARRPTIRDKEGRLLTAMRQWGRLRVRWYENDWRRMAWSWTAWQPPMPWLGMPDLERMAMAGWVSLRRCEDRTENWVPENKREVWEVRMTAQGAHELGLWEEKQRELIAKGLYVLNPDGTMSLVERLPAQSPEEALERRNARRRQLGKEKRRAQRLLRLAAEDPVMKRLIDEESKTGGVRYWWEVDVKAGALPEGLETLGYPPGLRKDEAPRVGSGNASED